MNEIRIERSIIGRSREEIRKRLDLRTWNTVRGLSFMRNGASLARSWEKNRSEKDESTSTREILTRSIEQSFTSRWNDGYQRLLVSSCWARCDAVCRAARNDKNNRYVIRSNYTYGARFHIA